MNKVKARLKAALIHLMISMLIFIVILYYIFYEWYPEPFFTAQGGWQGVQIMAFVDLVLGPGLTFIVFDPVKSSRAIRFDLGIVALVQVAAIAWGGYMVYSQRPVALVFWSDAFYTVTQDDYYDQGIDVPDFTRYSTHNPPLVYTRPLASQEDLTNFQRMRARSIPIYAQTALYENIYDNLDDIFLHQVDIEEITQKNTAMSQQLQKITAGRADDYRYVALKAKYRNLILVMNEKGEIAGHLVAPYLK